jgi:multidrug efflux pump subunit AcrB
VKVSVEMPAGTRLDETRRQLDDLTRQLGRIAGVTSTFATAGSGAQAEVNKGEILVNLVPIR